MKELLREMYMYSLDKGPELIGYNAEQLDEDELWLYKHLKRRGKLIFCRFQEESAQYNALIAEQAFELGLKCGMRLFQHVFLA